MTPGETALQCLTQSFDKSTKQQFIARNFLVFVSVPNHQFSAERSGVFRIVESDKDSRMILKHLCGPLQDTPFRPFDIDLH
jgi:hypothetical protein